MADMHNSGEHHTETPGDGRDHAADRVPASQGHGRAVGHGHGHGPASYDRAFAVGLALNISFVVVEVAFGLLAGSLALLADAAHNLSDVLSLFLAWGAVVLGRRVPTPRRTYGMRRSSILVALANALALLFVVGGVTWEAVRRFSEPAPVEGRTIIVVAAVGVMINGVTAAMFLSGRKRDVNLRGAFLHMASDAAVSLGVVLSGIAILATGWLWLDPAVSLGISLVILLGTWGLLRDSLNLALDAVPDGIDPAAVREYLLNVPGVVDVHDLHVWGMSTTETALTAHLVTNAPNSDDAFLARISEDLHHRFEIQHATIQLERGDPAHPCMLAPADGV